MQLARERGQRFAGFEQSRYASGAYFDKYLQEEWQPKTERVRTLFARAGISLPDRESWRQLRDDVMRYGIYNRYLQAVPPTGSIRTSTMPPPAFTRSSRRLRSAKRGKPGGCTTPRHL